MRAIRLIVSDLDGTLLSPEHELTDTVKRTIGKFVEQGGLFTFATGRPFLTASAYEAELGLDLPYILCNGSVLAQQGKVIDSCPFPLDDIKELLLAADGRGLEVLLFQEEVIRVFRKTNGIREYEAKERIICSVVNLGELQWSEEQVQKVILMGDMTTIQELWMKWVPTFRREYAAFQSEANYWEIIPGGMSKGVALQQLAEKLDIQPNEIMALGNQLNDLDMLRFAGVGVAVANSHAGLLEEADYVCSHSYGDGVIEAIERFALNVGRYAK